MKRVLILIAFPLILFALEPVNLIKDAGFERDSDLWSRRLFPDIYDPGFINRHDPDSAYVGSFCGSIDVLLQPEPSLPDGFIFSGELYQSLVSSKRLSDLDSFDLFHMCIFASKGKKYTVYDYGINLKCTSPGSEIPIVVWYLWLPPGATPISDDQYNKVFPDTTPDEGVWVTLERDLKYDLLVRKGLSENATLDTLIFFAPGGLYSNVWYGEKAFIDAIRLTGYADYDVGVKEILSGDSVWAGVYYKPVARIKSFGRQAADDFLAIAEIRQGESLVWADTIPYTLPADTEDTLEFDSFPIPNALSYTLTVRTEMYAPGALDESDEDDELSKPLYGTAIAENPISEAVTLGVESFTVNPRISYSLPLGQSGTISIYDASGRRVELRVIQGSGEVKFLPLASGVYFVKLETGKINITRKAVLLK